MYIYIYYNCLFTDYIDVLKSDISNLEDVISKLEKKKEDSVNKLNILTTFFKEQEKEYLKYVLCIIDILYIYFFNYSYFYILLKFV